MDEREELNEQQRQLLVAMGEGVLKVWLVKVWLEGREPISQLETLPPSTAVYNDFMVLERARLVEQPLPFSHSTNRVEVVLTDSGREEARKLRDEGVTPLK
jgi:hypothetical protein